MSQARGRLNIVRLTLSILLAGCVLLVPTAAFADGPGPAPAAAPATPVTHARELLTRSNTLDEAADTDEKSSLELEKRLPGLRVSAKAARDRAIRATGSDHDRLAAMAERLEADVIVSEAEVVSKRHAVIENRRTARELRVMAVNLVRGDSDDAPATADARNFGFLSLDAYPWCHVKIDGKVIGDTPLIHVQVPAGTHVVTLENFQENLQKTTEVTIKPGETLVKRLAY
jgi:hypothetical protein